MPVSHHFVIFVFFVIKPSKAPISKKEIWDDLQPLIIGNILTKFDCQKNYCQLTIDENYDSYYC